MTWPLSAGKAKAWTDYGLAKEEEEEECVSLRAEVKRYVERGPTLGLRASFRGTNN